MCAAWRTGTKKQYQTYINQWNTFCGERNTDPLLPNIENVLEFLTYLFYDRNLSYSAINTARSALSAYLVFGDGPSSVGNHPLIVKFMKGVFNMKPPVPRYSHIWDVKPVLEYLRRLSPARKLDLKKLSQKVVILLALTSAQRVQTLSKLSLDNAQITKTKVSFQVDEHIKQSRPGWVGCKVEAVAYPPDRRLCVVTYITHYIERTQSIRNKEQSLLVSYVKPHRKVSESTIARWIKEIMKEAGIDVNTFKSHSTRAASTSTAKPMDVPIEDILKTGGWSTEQTFQKFYRKPVKKQKDFATAVLDAAGH